MDKLNLLLLFRIEIAIIIVAISEFITIPDMIRDIRVSDKSIIFKEERILFGETHAVDVGLGVGLEGGVVTIGIRASERIEYTAIRKL